MFGILYKKAPPSVHVIHYINGLVRHEGPGASFWYFAPVSTIVELPLSSKDVPFIFHVISSDFQELTYQGQITYRIVDPAKLAQLIDFTTSAGGAFAAARNPEEL